MSSIPSCNFAFVKEVCEKLFDWFQEELSSKVKFCAEEDMEFAVLTGIELRNQGTTIAADSVACIDIS
jgi:hypothetical protein